MTLIKEEIRECNGDDVIAGMIVAQRKAIDAILRIHPEMVTTATWASIQRAVTDSLTRNSVMIQHLAIRIHELDNGRDNPRRYDSSCVGDEEVQPKRRRRWWGCFRGG